MELTSDDLGKVDCLWDRNTLVWTDWTLYNFHLTWPYIHFWPQLTFAQLHSDNLQKISLISHWYGFLEFIWKSTLMSSQTQIYALKHRYHSELNASDDYRTSFDTPACSISTRRRTWRGSRVSRCRWGWRSPWRVPSCRRSSQGLQRGSPLIQFSLDNLWGGFPVHSLYTFLLEGIRRVAVWRPVLKPRSNIRPIPIFNFIIFTFASFSTLSKVELSKKMCTTWRSNGILAAKKRFCLF